MSLAEERQLEWYVCGYRERLRNGGREREEWREGGSEEWKERWRDGERTLMQMECYECQCFT